MRLAFSNLAWPAESDTDVLAQLPEWGFPSVEVAPTRLWADPLAQDADEVASARRVIESAGLRVVALQSLLFQRPDLQLFGDAEARRGLHDHLAGMAVLAARLGATRLVFGSPGNRRRNDMPVDRADEIGVETFASLGAHAADLGVAFCIEANPEVYRCDYLTDAVASTAFVRAVDSPGVRLHLDTACMALAGDDPTERVREGADVLAHVHASAPQLGEVGPGGPVEHREVAEALRVAGYEGHVSVEMLTQPENPQAAVRRAADFVRSTYA
ncbi:sugar phosphate isomerase/epimerase [Blastococcus brunescens]|uniref:Sugar phosphate isomerase/epimerase n=1 Tax=Blastococcus brunescens TaxID=1564165 RepID=A0ABZ1AWH4_9ACTN|nr:sugar phosphate isomerase/epimerase [Blastococcus sp. BMG 8361]WRL62917.1 sugar phosphate isomerase/epimerase [Blastococcus sp. BMG 8361]